VCLSTWDHKASGPLYTVQVIRGVLILAMLGGCVESAEVVCSDGRLCPPNYTCDELNMRCLSAEQVAACAGREEGAECSVAGAPGACRSGACEPLLCGDGTRSVGEACDGADLGGATCKDAGFYDEAGLACTSFCTFDVTGCSGFCGDAIVNGSELCDGAPPVGACVDYGFDAGGIACGASCGIAFDGCSRFGWVAEPTTLLFATAFDATSPANIWVGGQTTSGVAVAHYNGSTWTTTSLAGDGYTKAVAVTGAADVWIVRDGTGGTPPSIERLVNGTFTVVTGIPAATYVDVWAAGPDAVYVATSDVGVLWWNGSVWQALGTLAAPIARIDGTAANDIWAVEASGALAHWTGSAWTPVAVDIDVSAIDPVGVDDVWAIGASTADPNVAAMGHWDGAQWTVTLDPAANPQTGSGFVAVVGTAANDAWVSEGGGYARHLDAVGWSPAGMVAVERTYGGFIDIMTFPGVRLAITFDGFLYRYRGQMYAAFATPSLNPLVASVSSSPTTTVAIDSRNFAYHFDGTTWTKKTVDTATLSQSNSAIWESAPNDIWVSGSSGKVFRYNGTTWVETANIGAAIRAIVGFSDTDVWFFGTAAIHYDGVTYEPTTTGNAQFVSASASGPNDLWAIAHGVSGGEVWHRSATAWNTESFATDLDAVVAFAPDDVHVAGGNRIFHWNGTSWTEQMLPVLDPILKLAGTGPDDVFALTKRQLLHFDGARWLFIRPPADVDTSGRPMANISVTRDRIDIVYGAGIGAAPFRRLLRTRLWNCHQNETVCDDGVDDDCDDAVDSLDTDCP